MAVITTAVAATVAAVATVGQAYAANKAAGQQQKMANIQNSRERQQALRAMRVRQRSLEGQGVASGTYGSSGMTGAMGAAASSTAGAIGYQGALLANAQQITNWNNMATGFGALASVGSAISQYPNMFDGIGKSGVKAPPKPTMATINTGSNFAGYA
jgi:hypothetical protein